MNATCNETATDAATETTGICPPGSELARMIAEDRAIGRRLMEHDRFKESAEVSKLLVDGAITISRLAAMLESMHRSYDELGWRFAGYRAEQAERRDDHPAFADARMCDGCGEARPYCGGEGWSRDRVGGRTTFLCQDCTRKEKGL